MFKKESLENLVFAVSLANLRLLQTWVLLLHQNTQTLELPELEPSYYYASLLGLVLTLLFWLSATWYRNTRSRLVRIILLIGFVILLIRPVNFFRLHLPGLIENTIFESLLLLIVPFFRQDLKSPTTSLRLGCLHSACRWT